jgi:biotin transport system ATP-binding protein
MKPALDLHNLSFSIGKEHHILKDITFSIGKGEFVVLGGRNGTGKSMLMRIIKGLLQPSGGTIFIDGVDLSRKPKTRNRSVGLVFQDADAQVVGQTVERDILFGLDNLGITGQERSARLDDTVSLLGLQSVLHQRPRTLSGGERRRLAIAGVLVMKPHVLMLDEPFANLDYPGIVSVLESLVALKEQGITILVATHEIEKVLAHADSLMLLDQGVIAAQGDPAMVLDVVGDYGIRRPHFKGTPIEVGELTWLK